MPQSYIENITTNFAETILLLPLLLHLLLPSRSSWSSNSSSIIIIIVILIIIVNIVIIIIIIKLIFYYHSYSYFYAFSSDHNYRIHNTSCAKNLLLSYIQDVYQNCQFVAEIIKPKKGTLEFRF